MSGAQQLSFGKEGAETASRREISLRRGCWRWGVQNRSPRSVPAAVRHGRGRRAAPGPGTPTGTPGVGSCCSLLRRAKSEGEEERPVPCRAAPPPLRTGPALAPQEPLRQAAPSVLPGAASKPPRPPRSASASAVRRGAGRYGEGRSGAERRAR